MIRKFYSGETSTLDFETLNKKIDSLEVTVDPVTPTADGLMRKEDKVKLDGIEINANNYVHPNDASTRHVTDEEKATWNGKATVQSVTTAQAKADEAFTNAGKAQTRADEAFTKAQEAFQSASDGKNKIATAITGMGVAAGGSESYDDLSNKIKQIKTKAIFS